MNELTARKQCIRRSAKYPRLELRVTKWRVKIQLSASFNRKNSSKSSTTDEKQPLFTAVPSFDSYIYLRKTSSI